MGEYKKTTTQELFIRLSSRKINSILPRLGARRTGNCHASIRQRLRSGRMVYSTTPFEELEVAPEAEDKRCIIIAVLRNQLAR